MPSHPQEDREPENRRRLTGRWAPEDVVPQGDVGDAAERLATVVARRGCRCGHPRYVQSSLPFIAQTRRTRLMRSVPSCRLLSLEPASVCRDSAYNGSTIWTQAESCVTPATGWSHQHTTHFPQTSTPSEHSLPRVPALCASLLARRRVIPGGAWLLALGGARPGPEGETRPWA